MNSSLENRLRTALLSLIAYYELFAILLIVLPPSSFPLIGLEPTAAAWPLRLAAIMVGAMGMGLFFPLQAPQRHWSLTVLIAFGQLVMPICTLCLIQFGDLPAEVGLPMALVDLFFLAPAVLALKWTIDLYAQRQKSGGNLNAPSEIAPLLAAIPDGSDRSIGELSENGPVLVLFLRHLGCTFCRATLTNLSQNLSSLRPHYQAVIVVTMSHLDEMLPLRARYHLPEVLLLSDPERIFYRALSIPVGSFSETLGWRVLRRGIFSGLLFQHGIGTVHSDPFQLPGSAAIHRQKILWTHPATDASEPLQAGSTCRL